MTNKMSSTYDPTTIGLHWATAILVTVLWIIGQTADWLPDGPVNTDYWSVHVVLGFALVIVLIWRLIWRRVGGRRLPAAHNGVLGPGRRDALFPLSVVARHRGAGHRQRL